MNEESNAKWKHNRSIFEYEAVFPDFHEAWSGHKYFAYDLIANTRPKVIVELGTHKGTSFFSFCQAVKDFNIGTEINAVDTWKGDPHSGLYGEEIFENFNSIVDKFYRDLSIKVHRMTFDEAVQHFSDTSVDVLHIDGYHTYEAVRHDFDTWFPKVSKNGIILLHDTTEMRDDFGVYRFWEELMLQFEFNFSFYHSHGLGVLFLNDSGIYLTNLQKLFLNASQYYDLFSDKEKYFGLYKYHEMQSWQHSQASLALKEELLKKELQNQENEKLISQRDGLIKEIESNFNKTIKPFKLIRGYYLWKIKSLIRFIYQELIKVFNMFKSMNKAKDD